MWQNFFYRSHNLLTIREHTQEKPYKCNEYGKSFYKSALHIHHGKHTEEKPLNVLSIGNPLLWVRPHTSGISYREETLWLIYVGKLFVWRQVSLNIGKFPQVWNPMNLMSVAYSSLWIRSSLYIKEFTQVRDPLDAMNVRRPTKSQPSVNIRKLTWRRNHTNVMNVGKPSIYNQP